MENKKIVILDFMSGKVFMRTIPEHMQNDDADEVVRGFEDDLGIRESDTQYMVISEKDFEIDSDFETVAYKHSTADGKLNVQIKISK